MLQVLFRGCVLFVELVLIAIAVAIKMLRKFAGYSETRTERDAQGNMPCKAPNSPILKRRSTNQFGADLGMTPEIWERLLGTDDMGIESSTDESKTPTCQVDRIDYTFTEAFEGNHVPPEDSSDSPTNCENLSLGISNFLRSMIMQIENEQKSVALADESNQIENVQNSVPLELPDASLRMEELKSDPLDLAVEVDQIEPEKVEQCLMRTEPSTADCNTRCLQKGTEFLPAIEEMDDEVNVEQCDDHTQHEVHHDPSNSAEERISLTVENSAHPIAKTDESIGSTLWFSDEPSSEDDGINERELEDSSEPNLVDAAVNSTIAAIDHPSSQESYSEIIPLLIKNIEPTLDRSVRLELPDGSSESPTSDTRSSSSITFKEISQKYTYMPQLVAAEFGMRESAHDWDVLWIQDFVSFRTCRKMKTYQRINHFPGSICLSNKDLLGRNLNVMYEIFPNEYNVFPKTWFVPRDMAKIDRYSRENLGASFIVKPHDSSCGSGIRITKRARDISSYGKTVCQLYIQRPFLIDGYKFDFRVYVLLTSIEPLRIFVHKEGLARFATVKYEKPSVDNSSRKCMHLTNTHINKNHPSYVREECSGSTRRITSVFEWFKNNRIDGQKVQSSMDDAIIKTIIASLPTLQHFYHMSFPSHTASVSCFELMGFDIMLDNKLNVYLLEVNVCPSFANETGTSHVASIKQEVVTDTFKILNLMDNERKIMAEGKQNRPKSSDQKRKMNEEKKNLKTKSTRQKGKRITDKTQKDVKSKRVNTVKVKAIANRRIDWEDDHVGNFRKIYPPDASKESYYQRFIDVAFSKLKPNQYLNVNGNELTDEQRKWLT